MRALATIVSINLFIIDKNDCLILLLTSLITPYNDWLYDNHDWWFVSDAFAQHNWELT